MERVPEQRAGPEQALEPERSTSPSATLFDAPTARLLALQRTAGNRAVSDLISRDARRMVARNGKPLSSEVGNEYEYKLEHKGERTSWSVRLIFSKAKTSPVKGSTGDVKGQLFASKVTRTKTAGAKACNSMAFALGKIDLTIAQPWPGISVNADLKAFEAKIEQGKVDVNVFKLGVAVQGKLSKDLKGTALGDVVMSSELGNLIAEGTVIKIQGKFEVNIDPSDVARLARLVRANGKMVREAARGLKAKQALDALEAQQKTLRQSLKSRRSRMTKSAVRRLEKRLAANATKIKTLGQRIAKSKAAVQVLEATAKAAAKGLRSKAGRLAGVAIAKAGGRLLLKLVPGLNLVLLAVDIWSVGNALYDLFTGKAKLGLPTGAEGSGKGTGDGPDAGAGGEGKGGGEQGGADAGGGGAGESHGTFELPPEISIDDSADAGEPQAMPELHPGAKLLLEKLTSGKDGTKVSAEELEDLNLLVPKDVTDEEAAKLAARFRAAAKASQGDPFAGLTGLVEEVRSVRAGTSTTTATDATGTQKLPDPEQVPTPSDEAGPDGRARKPAQATGTGGKGADAGKSGKGADAGSGAGGKGKGSGGSGGKKGKGSGKGPGLRDAPSHSAPGKLYYPGKDEAPGENVSQFAFRVVSGYNPTGNYRAGAIITIKIEFEKRGVTYKPSFDVRVVSHTKSDEKIVFEAVNVRRWRISDSPLEMPEGEHVTITSRRGSSAKPPSKKRKAAAAAN